MYIYMYVLPQSSHLGIYRNDHTFLYGHDHIGKRSLYRRENSVRISYNDLARTNSGRHEPMQREKV